jgi:hypothetical protein
MPFQFLMQGAENGIFPEILQVIATGISQGVEANRCHYMVSILESSMRAHIQGLSGFIDSRRVGKLQKQGGSCLGSGLLSFFIIFDVERSEILGHNRVTSLGMVFVVVAIPYTLLCAEAREVFPYLNFPSIMAELCLNISPPRFPFHCTPTMPKKIFHPQGERLVCRETLWLLRSCWFFSGNLRIKEIPVTGQ